MRPTVVKVRARFVANPGATIVGADVGSIAKHGIKLVVILAASIAAVIE